MWLYAARRIVFTIPIGLGVTLICFALIYLAPGDPIQSLLPPDATAKDIAELKHVYGLDKPIPVQYVIWLGRALTGDLGMSIQTNKPVLDEVTRAFANTFTISVISVILAMAAALVLGIVAAFHVGGWLLPSPCSASACRRSGWRSCL